MHSHYIMLTAMQIQLTKMSFSILYDCW